MIEDMASRDPQNDQCGSRDELALGATAALAGQREKLEAWARGRNAGMSNAAVALAVQALLADHAAQAEEVRAQAETIRELVGALKDAKSYGNLYYRQRLPNQNEAYCDAVDRINALIAKAALSADTGSGEG